MLGSAGKEVKDLSQETVGLREERSMWWKLMIRMDQVLGEGGLELHPIQKMSKEGM